MYSARIVVEVW